MLFGGTASTSNAPAAYRGFLPVENDQGLVGELFENPNAATWGRGRQFFDRAFTMKLSGSYRAPGNISIGVVARYQDGQNFARFVIAPDLAQGPEAIRAYPNGRSRFTYTLTVDGRVDKGFVLGSTRVGAALEAFNLLDTKNEVEEYDVSGPAWRTSTARQPGRVVRFALRVDIPR
jgi:hypothetical protein